MNKLVAFGIILGFGKVFLSVLAIDICDLHWLNRCDPYNKTCIITYMEPAIRTWFREGRADYFEDQVEPYWLDELVIPIENGSFTLKDVTIHGIGSSDLSDWLFDYGKNGLGSLQYTYIHNLIVKAKSISKVIGDDNPEEYCGPLVFKLCNIATYTEMPLWFTTRCTGVEYMAIRDDLVIVKPAPDNILHFQRGHIKPCHRQAFKEGAINTIGDFACRLLTSRFRMFVSQIGLHGFFNLGPQPEEGKCGNSTMV